MDTIKDRYGVNGMRLVETQSVETGTKLGKAIYNENGKILVNKGVALQGHTLR